MWDCPSEKEAKNLTDAELVAFFKNSPELKSVKYTDHATFIRFSEGTIKLAKGSGWILQSWPAHGILSEYGFYDIPAYQWRDH